MDDRGRKLLPETKWIRIQIDRRPRVGESLWKKLRSDILVLDDVGDTGNNGFFSGLTRIYFSQW
jgi:hypothetical protein